MLGVSIRDIVILVLSCCFLGKYILVSTFHECMSGIMVQFIFCGCYILRYSLFIPSVV